MYITVTFGILGLNACFPGLVTGGNPLKLETQLISNTYFFINKFKTIIRKTQV